MTIDNAKVQAKALRAALQMQATVISHAQALELIAKQHGAKDWNTLYARLVLRNGPLELALNDRVRGRYLGQPFTVQVIGLSGPANYLQISVRFDTPVDVARFEGFSNLRRQIKATINEQDRSHRYTSDGEPQLIVERENGQFP